MGLWPSAVLASVHESPVMVDDVARLWAERGAEVHIRCAGVPQRSPLRFRIRHEDNIDGDDATAVQFDVKVRRAKGGAWAHSGQGAAVFDKPLSITRVRIRSSFSGTSENFIVWCRSPSEDLIVNELVGSTWDNDGTEGVYRMADCQEVEVNTGPGVSWQFSQDGGATAFTPARSWAHTTGAGDELSTEALTDLATASDLERAWPRR